MKKLLFSLALVGAVIPKSGRWGKWIPNDCLWSSVVCRF